MTTLKRDIKIPGLESAVPRGVSFHEAYSILKKSGYDLVSLHEDAGLRIQHYADMEKAHYVGDLEREEHAADGSLIALHYSSKISSKIL